MSRHNLAWAERALEHFATTGEPYLEGIDAAVEVFDHDIPDADNPYRGLDGIVRWLRDFEQSWYSLELVPERTIDAGDRVVSLFRTHAVGAGSGVPVDRGDAIVWTFEGGRVVRLDYFNDQDRALAEAGVER